MTLSVSKARLRLSELIRRAEHGEEIRIARYNGPGGVRLVADVRRPDPRRAVDWKRAMAGWRFPMAESLADLDALMEDGR